MIDADDYDDLEFLDQDDVVDLDKIDPDVTKTLDSLMFFIGQNVVVGKEKIYAVQRLRRLIHSDDHPSPATIEAFALRAGKREKVALQLRTQYEGLLAGNSSVILVAAQTDRERSAGPARHSEAVLTAANWRIPKTHVAPRYRTSYGHGAVPLWRVVEKLKTKPQFPPLWDLSIAPQ